MFGGTEWKQGKKSIGFWFSQLLLASFLEASHWFVSKLCSHGFFQRSTHWKHLSISSRPLGLVTSVSGVYFDTSGVFFVEKSVEQFDLKTT